MTNSITRQRLTFLFIAAAFVFLFILSGARFASAQTDAPVGTDYPAIGVENPAILEQVGYPAEQPWWKRLLGGAGKLIGKLWGGAKEIGLWAWDGLNWIYISTTDIAIRLIDWWNSLPLWLQLLLIALGLAGLVRAGLSSPSGAARSFGGQLLGPIGKIIWPSDPEKGFACNPVDHYIGPPPITYTVRKYDYPFGKRGEEIRADAIKEAEDKVLAKLKSDLLKRAAACHCSGDCEKKIHNLEVKIMPPTTVEESHRNFIIWHGRYEATAKAEGSVKVMCAPIRKTP